MVFLHIEPYWILSGNGGAGAGAAPHYPVGRDGVRTASGMLPASLQSAPGQADHPTALIRSISLPLNSF